MRIFISRTVWLFCAMTKAKKADKYTPANRVSSAIGGIKKLLKEKKPLKKDKLEMRLLSILRTLSPEDDPNLLINALAEKSNSSPNYLLLNREEDLTEIRAFWGNPKIREGLVSKEDFESFIQANFVLGAKDIKPLKHPLRIEGKPSFLYSTLYYFYREFDKINPDLRWIVTNLACKSFDDLQNVKPLSVYSNMKKYYKEAEANDKHDQLRLSNSRGDIK
jgi:hypothetical protein